MNYIEISKETCELIDPKGTNAFKAITMGNKEVSHKYFLCEDGSTIEYAMYIGEDIENAVKKNLENIRVISEFI